MKTKPGKVKTKSVTLKIKVPVEYKYLAVQPWGEVSLFKRKPKWVTAEWSENTFFWDTQTDEISLLGEGKTGCILMKINSPENAEKSLVKI